MKRIILSLFMILILVSCGKPEKKFLSPDQIAKEKEKVKKVVEAYNEASEEENFADLVETLADEVQFFGTDSSEIISTFPDFKRAMMKQWDQYDKISYGELKNVFIQMDDQATFASIYFGVPLTITIGDETNHYFLRGNRTLKKEKNKWVIVSGALSILSQYQVGAAVDSNTAPQN